MEHFDFDGMAEPVWSVRVHAHNEREALEEAERMISWLDMSPSVGSTAQHGTARGHVSDPEND